MAGAETRESFSFTLARLYCTVHVYTHCIQTIVSILYITS